MTRRARREPDITQNADNAPDTPAVGYIRPELADLVVPITEVTTYPGNARVGDQQLIAQSLDSHGQYKPIVAQRTTGHVLLGNNTLATMHELGWTHVAVQWLDVDDDRARNILLIDNRTSDASAYDKSALAELLAEVDDWDASGWDLGDLDTLLAELGDPDNLGPDAADEQPAPRRSRVDDLSGAATSGSDLHDDPDTMQTEVDDSPPPDAPAQRELTLTLDEQDYVEATQLVAVGRAWLGRDRTNGQIIMSALRVLAVIGDARDDPLATVDVRAMLKAADYDPPPA